MRGKINKSIAENSSRGFVKTPRGLVDEMISKIPREMFESSTTTFLDPCMGRGIFLYAVAKELERFGHSKENICSRLVGVDRNPAYVNIAKRSLEHHGFGDIIIKRADALSYNFDMKFNVVIGNPPFNSNDTVRGKTGHRGQGKNIAKAFTLFAVSLSPEIILFIQPYGHRTLSSRLQRDYIDNGLRRVINCSDYFPTISQTVVYFLFNKKSNEQFKDEVAKVCELPNKSITYRFVNQPGKLSRNEYEHNLKDEGKVRVVVTTSVIKYTDDSSFWRKMVDKSYGSWRVVFNCTTSKNSIGKVVIAGPEDVLSKSVHCLKVESKEQALEYQKYLKLDSTEKLLASVKTGMCNSKKFLQYIPDIV